MVGPVTKEDFDNTLRAYGHNAYLRRRADEAGSGPYMRVAGGRYLNQVEMWTTYRVLRKSSTQGSSGFMDVSMEGFETNADAIFYFQSECEPKTSDLVIEDTPHQRTRYETYMVKRSVPYYIGSTLIYFAAICERIDPVV